MTIPPIAPSVFKETPGLEDRWLSSKEAARHLGITPSTLSAWRIKGVGPKYSASLGRDARYRLSELDEFMEAGLVANTVQAKEKRIKR